MALLISTNMYKAEDFKEVFSYVEMFEDSVGVEVFPMFHHKGYDALLTDCLPALEKVFVSFHGPYYKAEHSAPEGTWDYEYTMKMVEETLDFSRRLHSRYMVFHHNNCMVKNKEEMIRISCSNYHRTEAIFRPFGIPVAVENAGVIDRGTMLFDENEFIELCRRENYPVLIDIGHAHANGWDLHQVMRALKNQIVAYHLHNNDGVHDSHRRIREGTLDFEGFMEQYKCLTPGADLVLEYGLESGGRREGIVEDLERVLKLVEE